MQTQLLGALVQFKIPGSDKFNENSSGELAGIIACDNKIFYLILDHQTGQFQEMGYKDFRIIFDRDTNLPYWSCTLSDAKKVVC